MRRFVTFATAALLAAAASPLHAQRLAARGLPASELKTAPHKQAFTLQPISTIVGFYSAEYERVVSRSTTLGVGASYWRGFVGDEVESNDPSYLSLDAKLRYYPSEQPLRGFSFGLTGGYSAVTTHDCIYDPILFECSGQDDRRTGGPSVGFQLDYSWLLGRKENVVVALGAGAKRLFVKDREVDFDVAYPTARVSVGFAF